MEPILRPDEIRPGSPRSLGLMGAAVCILASLWPLLHGSSPRPVLAACALALAALAIFFPGVLRPANRLLSSLGVILGRIVSPVIMLFIYIVAVVPTGLLRRALGKDSLRLRFEPDLDTYWISRNLTARELGSMLRQY
jgi:hypothetical protein